MKALGRAWHLLRAGALRGADFRLLGLWLLLLGLPLVLVALPMSLELSEKLNHSLGALRLVEGFDAATFAELLGALAHDRFPLIGTSAVGLVVTLVLSPWLSGLVLAAASSEQPLGFGALLRGGLTFYWRMARLLCLAVVPWALAGFAAALCIGWAGEREGQAIVASDAAMSMRLALAVSAFFLLAAQASLDAARAQFALEPRRRSVLLAWGRGLAGLARRPGPLVVFALLTAAGLLVVALLGVGRLHVAPVGWIGLPAAWILSQAIVATLGWMRAARLFALIEAGKDQLGPEAPAVSA